MPTDILHLGGKFKQVRFLLFLREANIQRRDHVKIFHFAPCLHESAQSARPSLLMDGFYPSIFKNLQDL